MKPLPIEGISPQQQKHRQHKQGKSHQLKRFSVEIRKISKRLNKYADNPDLPDHEVIDLLEDTRRKVISLHIARQNLKKKQQKHRPGHRQS